MINYKNIFNPDFLLLVCLFSLVSFVFPLVGILLFAGLFILPIFQYLYAEIMSDFETTAKLLFIGYILSSMLSLIVSDLPLSFLFINFTMCLGSLLSLFILDDGPYSVDRKNIDKFSYIDEFKKFVGKTLFFISRKKMIGGKLAILHDCRRCNSRYVYKEYGFLNLFWVFPTKIKWEWYACDNCKSIRDGKFTFWGIENTYSKK